MRIAGFFFQCRLVAWPVFDQQPRHQAGDLVTRRLRQLLPKWRLQGMRSFRRVEQLKLIRFCVTAVHRHLLDSSRKISSLRSNQDRSKGDGLRGRSSARRPAMRIPTDPDTHSNDIRTVIPDYPDKVTRRR